MINDMDRVGSGLIKWSYLEGADGEGQWAERRKLGGVGGTGKPNSTPQYN